MAELLKISQVSKALQVPVPTLRRWTREFGSGLSPGARGVGNSDRLFQLEDLAFLRRVKMTMAKADVTYDEARRQLGLVSADPPTAGAASDREIGPPTEEERRKVSRYVSAIVEEVIAPYVERIEVLEEQVSEQKRQLIQLKALLDELSSDDSRGPRKSFPWSRL